MPVAVDFSRPPTEKEHKNLQLRVGRLGNRERGSHLDHALETLRGRTSSADLVLRRGFSYREGFVTGDSSDRKAPPRELRPSATRISSSRGLTLQFTLTLLALVQSARKAGDKARIDSFGFKVIGNSQQPGWTDLLVSDAVPSKNGRMYMEPRDKRGRSVRSALETLQKAGLVFIPGAPGSRGRFENFALLNECGTDVTGEPEEYRVPTSKEQTFALPAGFLENGWLHVLEDSEIALLLMVACKHGGWVEGEFVAIPAEVRLRNYGIHRGAFSAARKTLEWCGLLQVEEQSRHDDGRAEESELRVHRLALHPAGFEKPALETLMMTLGEQLARR